jgi:hypothetical protein
MAYAFGRSHAKLLSKDSTDLNAKHLNTKYLKVSKITRPLLCPSLKTFVHENPQPQLLAPTLKTAKPCPLGLNTSREADSILILPP